MSLITSPSDRNEDNAVDAVAPARGLAAPISVAALLAFTASYVETVGYIALFSLFTAQATGNLIVIAATVVRHGHGVSTKLLALPIFVLAVVFVQFVTVAEEAHPRRAAVGLLIAESLIVAGFMVFGLAATPVRTPDAGLPMIAGLLGVFAMGLQNALARTPLFSTLTPTTVMTGNLTRATMEMVGLIFGSAADRKDARRGITKTGPSILAFVLGAASGGAAFIGLGFWSLLAPILLLLIVAGLVSDPG